MAALSIDSPVPPAHPGEVPVLARIARSLAGATAAAEIFDHLSRGMLDLTRAEGAYVERVVSIEGTVEVVATVGEGTPPRGTSVPYPGSLTEEIIERGEPAAIHEIAGIGEAAAPYLAEACGRCEVLVVPILAEEGLLGTVVLLRGRESGPFEAEDVAAARVVGDLASLSLRRVMLLEESARRSDELKRAVRVRDEVLGIVSHDLRNPINTVMLAAGLLLEARLPEEQQRRQLEIITRAAGRMNRLIQDLLDVARMESGRLAVERVPQPVAPMVREAVESHRSQAEERSLTLTCAAEDDLPIVEADRDRVLQVFSNLVGNAIKFTPPGGTIGVHAECREGEVVLSVRDTGMGIAGEELTHLFEPYWQASRTAHLGAGLGLSIAKGIVEAHGGQIWVESEPGSGSTFWFTLPTAGDAGE